MKNSDLINTLVALGMFSTIGLAGSYVNSLSQEQAATLADGLKGTTIVAAARSESITRALLSPAPRPETKGKNSQKA